MGTTNTFLLYFNDVEQLFSNVFGEVLFGQYIVRRVPLDCKHEHNN